MNLGGAVTINPRGICLLIIIIVLVYFFYSGSGTGPSGGVRKGSSATTSTISLKQLLSVSLDVASRGGEEVVKIRKAANIGEKSKGRTWSQALGQEFLLNVDLDLFIKPV